MSIHVRDRVRYFDINRRDTKIRFMDKHDKGKSPIIIMDRFECKLRGCFVDTVTILVTKV